MAREKIYSKGETIGAYRVVRPLALGSRGTLYEATPDPELRADLVGLGIERVALKMARVDALPEDRWARRQLVERIDREARTLLALTKRGHPNVVEVYDFGWESGVPYLVMGLVEGTTLDRALEARPRLGAMMRVFGELCGAVAFLHNLGICHRDIKPANVMLRFDGGQPVLIDFGVCLPPAERPLTVPGEVLGTPAYFSPEHAEHWLSGKNQPYLALASDDVWALGIILYEILAGGLPWKAPGSRRETLMREIRKATLRHPSRVSPEVPKPLGEVAMRMLEKDVRKRPKNALDVLDLLREAAGKTGDVLTRVPQRRRGWLVPWSLPDWSLAAKPHGHALGWALTAETLLVAGIGLGAWLGSLTGQPPIAPPGATEVIEVPLRPVDARAEPPGREGHGLRGLAGNAVTPPELRTARRFHRG